MHVVVFGLTVTSSWGNGHATLWRALDRALSRRGHRLTFFERDMPWYASSRDLETLPAGELVLYRDFADVEARARSLLEGSDVAMVTSYCPDALRAAALVHEAPVVRAFYDMDTPVTLGELRRGNDVPWIGPEGLGDFDLVLSYSGGGALDELATRLGARRTAVLHGHVDCQQHRPVERADGPRVDLSYLGTYAEDRQPALCELFVEPARQRPDRTFLIGGAKYPSDFPWTQNMRFVRHLAPDQHPAVYAASRCTLNVTRADMAAMGHCPSGRLFEAGACATPILTDAWDGLETFFTPGEEVLVVRDRHDVLAALDRPEHELRRIGEAARRRVLRDHTADRRVVQLEDAVRPLLGCARARRSPRRAGEQRRRGDVWGIVPAAGAGSRIQPLAFSKELLPVGARAAGDGERPRAVSEYLVERMVWGGATRVCFVIAPGKSDILEYHREGFGDVHFAYVVQPRPSGLCDALFRALPLVHPDDHVLVGLPDTIWFPVDGFARMPADALSFLLFPVADPERFDAVLCEDDGTVREIRVKSKDPGTHLVWGAFKLPGWILADLDALWRERGRRDEYLGTLVNAWIAGGGRALAVPCGEVYCDVGTLGGYRDALRLEAARASGAVARSVPSPLAAAAIPATDDRAPETAIVEEAP